MPKWILLARKFFVYVVALDDAVRSVKKFRDRNPHSALKKYCSYVGQSIHDPDCRYRQHKQCRGKNISFSCICGAVKRPLTKNLSNRFVYKYGLSLRREVYEEFNPLKTRREAEDLEEALANALSRKDHAVWWG
ncbi:MAG: hypothetical protein COB53_08835 [Elusimicrobia bacterium]|nr:MAG: hypothetical protein COB53_08835 [Elusimicrobiota bacterium]